MKIKDPNSEEAKEFAYREVEINKKADLLRTSVKTAKGARSVVISCCLTLTLRMWLIPNFTFRSSTPMTHSCNPMNTVQLVISVGA